MRRLVHAAAAAMAFVVGCGESPLENDGSITLMDGGPTSCTTDPQCDDGTYCNGAERCQVGVGCMPASAPACPNGQRCSEIGRLCYTDCDVGSDADEDGDAAEECGGLDCDDGDPDVFFGALEVCNGEDDDCDTLADDGIDCSDFDAGMRDAGRRDGGGIVLQDAGMRDAGPPPNPCNETVIGAVVGSACRAGLCSGMDCQDEIATSISGLQLRIFPGSQCGDVCDPFDTSDPCGACGTCIDYGLAGRIQLAVNQDGWGACRSDCIPTRTDRGGCARTGYACEPASGTCLEACIDDTQCRYRIDASTRQPVFDGTSTARCNATTGRCTTQGTAGVVAGDACSDDGDCMTDGLCVDQTRGGYCVSLHCQWPAFACRTGENCNERIFGGETSACLDACTVGAEPVEDRLGSTGQAVGCPLGFSCLWDGASSAATGGCFRGNYNEITTSNVGAACTTDAECYSPFGYGECAFADLRATGICTIRECFTSTDMEDGILPDIVVPGVCDGTSELCVDFSDPASEPPRTMCLQTCTSADQCAAGYACTAIISGGARVCWPECLTSADCPSGVSCVNESGGTCGTNQICTCGT
jgi:hypothetical protein